MYIDFIKYIYLDKFILIIENHLSIKVSLSLTIAPRYQNVLSGVRILLSARARDDR